MTYAEMSVELDVIYENINKGGAPGLDGYEKSVILTHAEELYVKEVLKVEPSGDRFPELVSNFTDAAPAVGIFDPDAVSFLLPSSYLKILNEELLVTVNAKQTRISLLPITNELFTQSRSSAYKYPPRRRAWRLPISSTVGKIEAYLRGEYTIPSYYCRYIRKPKPIIVENLRTISPFNSDMVDSYSITNGGSGYSVNDVLSVTGTNTNATFQVTTVNAGVITGIVMLTRGAGITAGVKSTARIVPSTPANTTATITVTVVSSDSIDSYYLPQDCELNAGLHRDILKIAATLAEQYYMDKYGNNNGTTRDQ